MADFRRWLTVLAVIAVMAFAASAQVGIATGSAGGPLACNASAAGTPTLRPEGFTELVGDILITCTGGGTLTPGSEIPTTNIVVYTTPGVPITSRFLSSNGASEAVLIIDEAGTGELTGAPGYGPQAPQTPCSYAQQQALGGTQCPAFVGVSGAYQVAVTAAGGTTPAANVYQGKIGDFGQPTNNAVAFYNVPILPPATGGVTRVYHITNIRVPVPSYFTPGQQIGAFISSSGNQALPLSQSQLTIGIVGPFMKASVTTPTAFQQCTPESVATSANLVFTEGFATGFKTRVVPGGSGNGNPATNTNTLYAAEATNTSPPIQNIPGGYYGGFAQDTESGFIFPAAAWSTTYTAGLADYGTRLKAVFTNIPSGLTLYVSTTSATISPISTIQNAFVVGGTSLYPYAVLVATNSTDAIVDGTPFKPIAATAQGDDGLGAFALVPSGGSASAVWEVTNANSGATDTLTFTVYVSYTYGPATPANPYGTPVTGLPLTQPPNNVALSYAPEPGGGSFTVGAAQGALPIPRFIISSVQSGPFVSVSLCQTTLLYPFVTGASGFDTGIAVANTSVDPFGTAPQTGSCKLWAYGTTSTSSTVPPTAFQTSIGGCDLVPNPLPSTNCFPVVTAGQVGTVLASTTLPNFTGYVIAVCNFQYAHGYAAVTDLGIRNLWSSYLALELNNAHGTNRVGVAGIEALRQ